MYKDFQNQITKSLNEQSRLDYKEKDIFLNSQTIRLTKRGKNLMCKYYDNWTFESPGTKAQNTLSLLRKMTYPYYIDTKHLILFTEKDAFMARLAGAQGWLDGK
jgi:hypothetical protein